MAALILAAVALITAIAIGGILSARSTASDARQAKDFALALAYEHRRSALEQCQHDNSAALARIASAEAIVNIGAHANPTLRPSLQEQLLLAAFIKKVNAAIEKNNPLMQCSLPALGLPKLPPITNGAQKILNRGLSTTTTAGGTVPVVPHSRPAARDRPTTTLKRDAHRPPTTTQCLHPPKQKCRPCCPKG